MYTKRTQRENKRTAKIIKNIGAIKFGSRTS